MYIPLQQCLPNPTQWTFKSAVGMFFFSFSRGDCYCDLDEVSKVPCTAQPNQYVVTGYSNSMHSFLIL